MKLRTFDPDKDFEKIKSWISDERSHAMWCAGRFQYPLDKKNLLSVLSKMEQKTGDEPLIAATDDDKAVGFLCYSLNPDIKEGKLKFVIVDPQYRGKGIAVEMLHLVISRAFEDEKTKRIALTVFSENPAAKKCYEKAGFSESPDFMYKEETWGRCNMVIERDIES